MAVWLLAAPAPVTGLACPSASPAAAAGVSDPFHVPTPIAAQLNADGKLLYRQGRWDEARSRYRAAEAADPHFLAPALNVACSFVRQDRYGEALAEVLRLIDRAYLPWSEEVLAAADLGALKVRAEGKQLRTALDRARSRWAEGLRDDVIMVARLRPPLKLGEAKSGEAKSGEAKSGEAKLGEAKPQAPGTGSTPAASALVLGQRQEIFAWSPRTGLYRQLTSEEGRVLAMARSRDGRRIAYITAEKLLRDGAGRGAGLRGVAIHELDLGTLTALGRHVVAGDVRQVAIVNLGVGFAYRIDRGTGNVATWVLTDGEAEVRGLPRTLRPAVTLDARGVAVGSGPLALPGGCPGTVREQRAPGRPPTILVKGKGKGTGTGKMRGRPIELAIGGPHAAALAGLPIP